MDGFSIPGEAPFLNHASLELFMGGRGERKFGTLVTIGREPLLDAAGERSDAFSFRLYRTLLAYIYPTHVVFLRHDNAQMTTEWLAKIMRDNGIEGFAGDISGNHPAYPPERKARSSANITSRSVSSNGRKRCAIARSGEQTSQCPQARRPSWSSPKCRTSCDMRH